MTFNFQLYFSGRKKQKVLFHHKGLYTELLLLAQQTRHTEVSVLTSEGSAPYLSVPFPFEANEAKLKAGRHLGAAAPSASCTAQQGFGAQPKE